MKWNAGSVCASHSREAWDQTLAEPVQVHCRLEQLNGRWDRYGEEKAEINQKYAAAKLAFHVESALDLVDRCWNPIAFSGVVKAILEQDRQPRIIFPHLPFDDEDAVGHQSPIKRLPTNALPLAFARVLASRAGCELDENIVQSARVGRTKLGMWLRFLCQPSFVGEVSTNEPYILVDDVFTTGGTLAALRSYIVRSGGTVIATTTLAQKFGKSEPLAIAGETLSMLISVYGPGFEPYWREATGHDASCLTEAEGQFLVAWARDEQIQKGIGAGDHLLQHVRTRLNKAAAKGG